jgi:hypothetical protein
VPSPYINDHAARAETTGALARLLADTALLVELHSLPTQRGPSNSWLQITICGQYIHSASRRGLHHVLKKRSPNRGIEEAATQCR